jgi:hypothetical protein
MPSYCFEVWQGDGALHRVRNVELERPARAWDQVRHLAKQFGAPGRRIVVRDERGDIAILSARPPPSDCSPGRRPDREKKDPAGFASAGLCQLDLRPQAAFRFSPYFP